MLKLNTRVVFSTLAHEKVAHSVSSDGQEVALACYKLLDSSYDESPHVHVDVQRSDGTASVRALTELGQVALEILTNQA